jgi:YYY domain-containing protein
MTFWEMAGVFLRWWASMLILGLALWPIAFQCFRRLPDRGWSFMRMAGVLAAGYFFWLGCWLRLWPNLAGAVWLCAGALFAAGTVLARVRVENPWGWLREHYKEALFTEGVFFLLFAGLTWIRSYDAGAVHTERPMDLAFLNAVMRSTYFPPDDPWLSGYAISYYHFGYILTGMLGKMAGIPGSIAFNLGVSGSFSLAGLGAYGLLRNLLLLKARGEEKAEPAPAPVPAPVEDASTPSTPWRKAPNFWTSNYLWLPLLATFTLLFLGNLEGFLEILHQERVGWQDDQGPFWTALDINQLNQPPTGNPGLMPTRSWWWWMAARVINERTLGGESIYSSDGLIDEFPAFSFVIGDMHPHVLALPFLLLAVAVAFETFLRAGGAAPDPPSGRWLFIAFTMLSFGSLLFLNTWDILLFGMAAVAGWMGWKMSRRELVFGRFSGWKAFIARWAVIGVAAVALFIPFLIGFSSQAGGILPNVLFPTKGGQYFVFFGTLFVPIFAWVILELAGRDWKLDWRNGLSLALGGLAVLLVGSLIVAFYISLNPDNMEILADVLGGYGALDAMSTVLVRRLADPWATLLPLALIAAALTALFGWIRKGAAGPDEPAEPEEMPVGKKWADAFVLILVGWGALLALAPEYFYLRDMFGSRMNTVFKFYFQAWALLSLPAAYGVIRLGRFLLDRTAVGGARRAYAAAASVAVLAVLLLGAVYYPMAVYTKTNEAKYPGEPTLDAMDFVRWMHPEDAAAIEWIRANIHDDGPFVEAVGHDYDEYAGRVATHTGIPSLLGWIGHEDQWRGTRAIHGPRIEDVEQLYKTTDWFSAQEILDRYGIRYVYFGPLEQQMYGTRGLDKFRAHMNVIYEAEGVVIFERGKA